MLFVIFPVLKTFLIIVNMKTFLSRRYLFLISLSFFLPFIDPSVKFVAAEADSSPHPTHQGILPHSNRFSHQPKQTFTFQEFVQTFEDPHFKKRWSEAVNPSGILSLIFPLDVNNNIFSFISTSYRPIHFVVHFLFDLLSS
jgi:hypothetical protein